MNALHVWDAARSEPGGRVLLRIEDHESRIAQRDEALERTKHHRDDEHLRRADQQRIGELERIDARQVVEVKPCEERRDDIRREGRDTALPDAFE